MNNNLTSLPCPNLSYLSPPDAVYNVVHSKEYISKLNGNIPSRKIFYKQEYTDLEQTKIKELKEELKKQQIQLYPEWDDVKILKYVINGKGDLQNSIGQIKLHLQWYHNKVMHTLTPIVQQLLQKGIVYHFGKDKQFRPIFIMNAYMMEVKSEEEIEHLIGSISFLLQNVIKHTYVKGFVENQIVILEINNMGLGTVPATALKRIVQTLTTNFTCSLDKMFILNPSFFFDLSWRIVKQFLTKETLKKIQFIKNEDLHKLKEYIDADQLEEKYGGIQPNIKQYWPPQSNNKVVSTNDESEVNNNQDYNNNIKQYAQSELENSFYTLTNRTVDFYNNMEQNGEIDIFSNYPLPPHNQKPQQDSCCGRSCSIF